MENDDKNTNMIGNSEFNSYNLFRIDYINQNYKNSAEFQRWKTSMLNKYGRNAILYKCNADKVLFYAKNEDYKNYPFCQSICPQCKNPICYHCHRFKEDHYGNGSCCIRRKIYCAFFQDGLRLINPTHIENDYPQSFRGALFYFLIPGYNLLFFIETIHIAFFYKLGIKNYELKKNNGYITDYENRINNNYTILQIVVVFDVGLSILLTFSFILLNIYFIIFMLIISLPFKLIPMKYYMGIAYGTIST